MNRFPSRIVGPRYGARGTDSVELWKAVAEEKMRRQAQESATPLLDLKLETTVVPSGMLLGLRYGPLGMAIMPALIISLLLVHELPRALLARRWGRSATIGLSMRGGTTEITGEPWSGARRVAFVGIGSIANLTTALVGWAIWRHAPGARHGWVLLGFSRAHALWALVQIFPILPFHAGRALLARLSPSQRLAHAAGAVLLVAVGLALMGGRLGSPMLMPVTMLALYANVRAALDAQRDSRDERLGNPAAAARAEAYLAAGDPRRASSTASDALRNATSLGLRARLWKTLAWAAIGRQDPFVAHAALGTLPLESVDPHLVAAYLACCNRSDEAVMLLEAGRRHGYRSPETTKLLMELYYRRDDIAAIRALLRADSELLSAGDRATVESAILPATA